MNKKLFRKEVIEAKQTKWAGSIILTRPFSFTFLTCCSLFIASIIIGLFIYGDYTKRSTVKGQLVPESGLIQVYTTQQGIILKKNIYEGIRVKKGDVLYVISIKNNSENGDTMSALSQQTQLKDQSIRNEIYRSNLLHQNEKKTILNQMSLIKEDLVKIDDLLINQKNRVSLAKNNKIRYELALKQNATSQEELEVRHLEYLNHLSEYESLEREKLNLEKQLKEQIITLTGLRNRQQNETEQLKRLLLNNTQEMIEIQSNYRIAICANASGSISTVNAEVGQFVDISKPLVTILPEDTPLIAQLYVPSRAIGFVKEGDPVLLRYQAYPYQKFGHAKAVILSVSKTAIAGQDIKSNGVISPQEQLNNEPIYLVRTKLDKQFVKAYGKDLPLRAGMTLDGDIMHETRKLYEWVLEPLFSITGKI